MHPNEEKKDIVSSVSSGESDVSRTLEYVYVNLEIDVVYRRGYYV